jgi:hypothetical protein
MVADAGVATDLLLEGPGGNAFNPRARGGKPSAAPGRGAVVASALASGYLIHPLEAVHAQRGARRGRHSGEVKPARPALFGVGHQRVTLDPGLGHVENLPLLHPRADEPVGAGDLGAQPPATAGRMVTSSPSSTEVSRPSRKRMSSPPT